MSDDSDYDNGLIYLDSESGIYPKISVETSKTKIEKQNLPSNSPSNIIFSNFNGYAEGNLVNELKVKTPNYFRKLMKKSKFLEKLNQKELNEEEPKSTSKHITIPSFCADGESEIDKLNSLCSRLQKEKELMKLKVSSNKTEIKLLKSRLSKLKASSIERRASNKRNEDYNIGRKASVGKRRFEYSNIIKLNESILNKDEDANLPFIFRQKSENKRIIYSRDKPLLSRHLRIPLDVFCNKLN